MVQKSLGAQPRNIRRPFTGEQRKLSYVGDHVLLLLPMQYNRLKLEWAGPYKMIKRVTLVEYEVETTSKMGQ